MFYINLLDLEIFIIKTQKSVTMLKSAHWFKGAVDSKKSFIIFKMKKVL